MIAWVSTDDTGHVVCSVVADEYDAEDMVRVEVDDDFDWNLQADYVLQEDGTLVYDGAWTAKLEQERKDAAIAQETEDQLKVAARMFVQSATALTDEQARSVSHLHREWKVGDTYTKGQIIIYEGELYRCGQPELTASDTYKPGDPGTTALYSHTLYSHIEMEEGIEVWKEWDGVSGVYAEGQKVKDPNDGKIYESKIPNNVWGPPSAQPDYWRLVPED